MEDTYFLRRGVLHGNNELCLTAVGRLIRSIHTVIVLVTNPHPWDTALGDGTLELVGGACHFGCTRDTTDTPLNTEELQPNHNFHK